MSELLFIALGGALGSLARYGMGGWAQQISRSMSFPWGTLVVNLTGAFVIGILWGISERFVLPSSVRIFLFVGFLGAFTTFSTFCLENLNLFRDGEWRYALVNIGLSNVFGLLLVICGFVLARKIFI